MALNQGNCLVICVIDTEDGDMLTAMLMGKESCRALFMPCKEDNWGNSTYRPTQANSDCHVYSASGWTESCSSLRGCPKSAH